MSSRRTFLEKSATLAALGFLPRQISAEEWLAERDASRREIPKNFKGKTVVISAANGYQDAGMGIKVAYDKIVKGDDTLDAIIAGVNCVELDVNDQSVGIGGLPNAEGVVQLDASCMHGPSKRAGSVASLEGIATPSNVAKAVMDYTDHVMLAGHDAKRFALAMGFKEQNLLTPKSKADWEKWKATRTYEPWTDAKAKADWMHWNAAQGNKKETPEMEYDGETNYTHGTINMNAVSAAGDVSSVTTTSGISWKIPGRVGDSPIIGAGQYTDNSVGAAGSTGRGESNIMVCGAFLAVEFMRQGMAPQQALMKTMERVIAHSEKRLLAENGRPKFGLTFYAITKDGRYAGAAAYEGTKFAVCDEKGPRLEECAYLYKASEDPSRKK